MDLVVEPRLPSASCLRSVAYRHAALWVAGKRTNRQANAEEFLLEPNYGRSYQVLFFTLDLKTVKRLEVLHIQFAL